MYNMHQCSSLQMCLFYLETRHASLQLLEHEAFKTFCSLFCQKSADKSCSYKAGELDTLW